jgi:formaldehyde-activating enzyme involved in methanogenesis
MLIGESFIAGGAHVAHVDTVSGLRGGPVGAACAAGRPASPFCTAPGPAEP